ncbi:SRF-TF domain containing protein [Asbolus verrucosus]|uniref:SRF-TF domain containing protein n=1 Tax=Asbolus verrucosus TaxID=1661398 RepID=A0A482VVB0_ASBVE|nr:SRF-TF domain containing protein [Asbolus verrucosus]
MLSARAAEKERRRGGRCFKAAARGRSASIGRGGALGGQSSSRCIVCSAVFVCTGVVYTSVTRCCSSVVKLWCEMEPPGGRDSRFNLGYSMNLLSGETPEIYNPALGRPSTSLQQLSPRHTMVSGCGGRGLKSDICYDDRGMPQQAMGLEACVNDIAEDTYSALQPKKSPPSNGKKTKGRVKIKMEYIENKLRRYTTFSKRKTGIMKKVR